jgi:hypothetical protein
MPGGPGCGEICEEACSRSPQSSSGSAARNRIFYDDFESDVVGAAPSTAPAGDPLDDQLVYSGATGTLSVVGSGVAGSQAGRLDRGSAPMATVMEMVSGGGGPHTTGRYRIRWRAYAEADKAILNVRLLSSSGRQAFRLHLRDGRYELTSGSGAEVLATAVSQNAVREFDILVDMDAKSFTLTFVGVAPVSRPFIDALFEDLRLLRFDYPPALLEALPGTYVIDVGEMLRL